MEQKYSGHVLVVMAPMGSGKGTLERYAFENFPEMLFSISCTSRAIRPGEVNGVDYHFISREEFEKKIENGEFFEWAEFGGNLYGTLTSQIITPLENERIILVEIELQGVEQLMQLIPKENRTIVYIEAGDWKALKARALARAPMSEEELKKRYERYLHEIAAKPLADIVITNTDGNLESAKEDFNNVVEKIIQKIHHE